MDKTIIVALIAFTATITTALISWLVSRFTVSSQIHKLQLELRHIYANRLHEKRVEVYPAAYELLSEFAKINKTGDVTRGYLDNLAIRIAEWDSKYSIFLSASTTPIAYNFRKLLAELSDKNDQDLRKVFDSHEERKRIYRAIAQFELALKGDIGIFAVEFYSPEQQWKDYPELEQVVREVRQESTAYNKKFTGERSEST